MPKTKKVAKKIKSEKDVHKKERHFEVVLEDINSKMTLVLEGHSSLDKKIDDFKGEFVEFKEETNGKFKIVGERFNRIDEKIEKISDDSDELKSDMVFVKSKLSSIENGLKQKVDIEQFEQLEQRVIRLEGLAVKR